jgi:hypothetical protein
VDDEVTWLIDGTAADPVHVRTIEVVVLEDTDRFEVVGRLDDRRPWADGTQKPAAIHSMELRLKVDRATLTIVAADARMHDFPHAECPSITPAFKGLIGLSVARGYTRAVQERFGRQLGCSHLEFLARAMGPVVIQSIPSSASRLDDPGALGQSVAGGSWLANTCHLWAEDGAGMAKLAAGWRPGMSEYPTPLLVEIRRRIDDHGDASPG